MARVEISQNKGPEVITSVDGDVTTGSNFYSPAVNVSKYTLHSYQLSWTHSGGGSKNITFTIIGSNVDGPTADYPKDWITISTHTVAATSGAYGTLAYSDVWNFKYAKVLIQNSSGTTATVKVYEKHNA